MAMQPLNQPPVRVQSFPIYDTHRLSGATLTASTLIFFQNGLGSLADGFTTAPGKTVAESNLSGRGLPNGQAYRVDRISVFARVADQAASAAAMDGAKQLCDISNILRNSALQYQAGAELVTYGPAEFFPGGGGVVSAAAPAGGATTEFGQVSPVNGAQSHEAIWRLSEKLILRDGQSFFFNLKQVRDITTQDASAKYDLTICLWGVSFQEVQG